MKCMKCAVSIPSGQVFCENCLADMEKHPVSPNAPLILPRRDNHVSTKHGWKRPRKPEEQLPRMRKLIFFLMAVILILTIALTVAIYGLYKLAPSTGFSQLPGQNYGTSESCN